MTDLEMSTYGREGCTVARPEGRLSAGNYGWLRDELIKQAMEQPSAVIVDVDALGFESTINLTVFSSVWMRINDWPGVPIMLVAGSPSARSVVGQSGVGRFVPVFEDVATAIGTLNTPPKRLRVDFTLPADSHSSSMARRRCTETCRRWGIADERAESVAIVATELVENAIRHAGTEMRLRFELRDTGVFTAAVRDGTRKPAVLREAPTEGRTGLGLRMVAGTATAWGCLPDRYDGKVVWATLTS